ncbi:MAG: ABC transporter permease [Acidimicrobiia bacterium]|nr:ABC transporter permease [Acidimicrobiia bacterium]
MRLVSGPLAAVAVALLFAVVVALVVVAITAGPETRRRLAPYGLLQPGILWLALFYLAPLFTLLRESLSTKASRFDPVAVFDWNFSNYTDAFRDFGPQFTRGFTYAALATVLCIVIGYPLAYVIAFRGGRWRNLLLGLVVVPFFTSYLIRTIAWSSLLADSGPIVATLEQLRLTGLLEALQVMDNGRLLNTPAAVIGGLTYNFLPFMILPIYVSLEKIEPALVDAAKDLYSPAPSAFRRVVLPLSLPGVFAGTLLTFIPAAGDFINAQYLGNPNTTMIGNSIQDQFLRQNNYPLAAAMSFVLMAVITVAVFAYTKFMGTEELA